jgi:hypothetical protein
MRCGEQILFSRLDHSLLVERSLSFRLPSSSLLSFSLLALNRGMCKSAISYLWYPAFDEEGHSVLTGSFMVFLGTEQVRHRDYSAVDSPPVLHRKEEFLGPEYPGRDQFAALTAEEERAGLYDDVTQIGTRFGWEKVLASKGLTIRGHAIVRLCNGEWLSPWNTLMRNKETELRILRLLPARSA